MPRVRDQSIAPGNDLPLGCTAGSWNRCVTNGWADMLVGHRGNQRSPDSDGVFLPAVRKHWTGQQRRG